MRKQNHDTRHDDLPVTTHRGHPDTILSQVPASTCRTSILLRHKNSYPASSHHTSAAARQSAMAASIQAPRASIRVVMLRELACRPLHPQQKGVTPSFRPRAANCACVPWAPFYSCVVCVGALSCVKSGARSCAGQTCRWAKMPNIGQAPQKREFHSSRWSRSSFPATSPRWSWPSAAAATRAPVGAGCAATTRRPGRPCRSCSGRSSGGWGNRSPRHCPQARSLRDRPFEASRQVFTARPSDRSAAQVSLGAFAAVAARPDRHLVSAGERCRRHSRHAIRFHHDRWSPPYRSNPGRRQQIPAPRGLSGAGGRK